MKIIIGLGAGGSTKVIIDILNDDTNKNKYKLVGLLDDDPQKIGTTFKDIPIIGRIDDIKKISIEFDEAIICIGAVRDTNIRNRVYNYLLKQNIKISTIISAKSIISNSVVIGNGCTIMPGAIINSDVKIGNNVLINTGSLIEHDCTIGDHCFIAPGCVISGAVEIGTKTFMGSNSVISSYVKIEDNVTIGAGSVIVRNVPSNSILYGNPAHHFIKDK